MAFLFIEYLGNKKASYETRFKYLISNSHYYFLTGRFQPSKLRCLPRATAS